MAVASGFTREVEDEYRRRIADRRPPGMRPYHFLALSGGGMYGAFGVGVLSGWTDTGNAPVSSTSSPGSAPEASSPLMPSSVRITTTDLKVNLLGVQRRDILGTRGAVHLPFADAVYTSRPLERRIDEEITTRVLAEVAAAHAAGRRLYIGTTNIDTHRLVIWDMGAIASRGTRESARTLPPDRPRFVFHSRRFSARPHRSRDGWQEVLRNARGRRRERRGDLPNVHGGGSEPRRRDARRIRTAPVRTPRHRQRQALRGSEMHSTPNHEHGRSQSFRSIIYGKTRDELYRIYLNCLETGVDFHLTAVPQNFKLEIDWRALDSPREISSGCSRRVIESARR